MNQQYIGNRQTKSLKGFLIKAASGNFLLKISGAGFGFLISLALARLLGADGLGVYTFSLAWIALFRLVTVFGNDKLLVRNTASYMALEQWSLVKGLLLYGNRLVFVLSLLMCVLIFYLTYTFSYLVQDQEKLYALWLALVLLPITSLTSIRRATLQGFHRTVLGNMPELFLQPALMVALLACAYFFVDNITASSAIWLNIISSSIAFLAGIFLLFRLMPESVKVAKPIYDFGPWLKSGWPLMIVGGMHIIHAQADIVMLGLWRPAEDIGIYAICVKLTSLITFFLLAANSVLSPVFAKLNTEKKIGHMQRVVTLSTVAIFCISAPIAIALMVFPVPILAIFGGEFLRGSEALIILSAGQLINVAAGSVGILLIMTGHERVAAAGLGASAIVNITLNAVLIPTLGINGAAYATLLSLLLWNSVLVVLVWRRLDIVPTVFGAAWNWART